MGDILSTIEKMGVVPVVAIEDAADAPKLGKRLSMVVCPAPRLPSVLRLRQRQSRGLPKKHRMCWLVQGLSSLCSKRRPHLPVAQSSSLPPVLMRQ